MRQRAPFAAVASRASAWPRHEGSGADHGGFTPTSNPEAMLAEALGACRRRCCCSRSGPNGTDPGRDSAVRIVESYLSEPISGHGVGAGSGLASESAASG
jgi:hypothetical protein